MRSRACLLIVTLFLPSAHSLANEPTGIQVPDGFVVTRFASDDLAHDIYSMTIDAQGHVVVAGPGYVRTLLDRDNDGIAESFRQFSSVPSTGAHGMVFDGADLICTGDNAVMRIRDTDGDGVADQSPEVWARLRNPEHGANGLIQGPDGWFYLICGNDAGVNASHAQTSASPVHDPSSGALVRFSASGKTSEVVAEGFRNPYDLSINRFGHIFTMDSDGERDHHLPWYVPTRLFDIAEGEHHGWVNNGWKLSWSRPVSFFDNVDRVAEMGRGSPTGLVVYSHRRFPKRYRNGVFSCCWTLGRVYYIPLNIKGATYAGTPEVFLQTIGDVGFAPVDLAVAPSGDLFVAIGGRGTQGSVFRIRYSGEASVPQTSNQLTSVLDADQPLSAWSRAIWVPIAAELGVEPFQVAALNDELSMEQRIRSIEILVELFGGVPPVVVRELTRPSTPSEVTARIAWAIGRGQSGDLGAESLVTLAESANPRVARAALDQLASLSPARTDLSAPQVDSNLATTDRRIRNAWIRWLAANVRVPRDDNKQTEARVLQRRSDENGVSSSVLVSNATRASNRLMQLELLRLLQLQLGDINVSKSSERGMVGYSSDKDPEELNSSERAACERYLLSRFPTNAADIDQEIARLAAMLRPPSPAWPQLLIDRCSELTEVESDIHYLMSLAHVTGHRSEAVSERTASTLLNLHRKMFEADKYPSRNWPIRVADAFRLLSEQDPRLAAHLIDHPDFGAAAHSLFVLNLPESLRIAAATNLAAQAGEFDDEDWDAALVQVIALLPDDEAFPVLRAQWPAYGLRNAIVDVLARSPIDVDRARFVESLQSASPTTVTRAATALVSLPPTHSVDDLSLTMTSLQRHCSAERYSGTRKALLRLLVHWTGEQFAVVDDAVGDDQVLAAYEPCFDWFSAHFPQRSAKLRGLAGQTEWRERLDGLNWSLGDASRGRAVYERFQCAACHSGNRRLGPELKPIARRFSRADLFAAIIDPNQSVSPLYQTKRFETRSGRVYSGMVVYQSPNGTLLQLGPDEVVRIAEDEIVAINDSPNSLMPSGLLREATNQNLTDLYAYLQQLARQ